jgi:hypothetical protein
MTRDIRALREGRGAHDLRCSLRGSLFSNLCSSSFSPEAKPSSPSPENRNNTKSKTRYTIRID